MASKVIRKVIETSRAPKPVGPYNQAVAVNHTLYVSGQIGLNLAGEAIVPGGVEAEAKQTLENLKGVLEGAGSSLGNVVKTTILLQDINDWPKVNTVYKEYFTSRAPARAAYAVAALPMGAKVEIEAIAVLGEITDQ